MMKDSMNLFADFSPSDKSEWLAKVEKDLKGKPLEDLNWMLEESIQLSPFFGQEDQAASQAPITKRNAGNSWELGEYIEVEKTADANQEALEGLNGGVEALGFQLNHPIDLEGLHELMAGIDASMISTNFGEYYPDKNPLDLLNKFLAFVKDRGWDANEIRGSIDFDPILDWAEPPMGDLAKAIQIVSTQMPHFKILQVNGVYYHAGAKESSRELGYILAKCSQYLFLLQEMGIAPSTAIQHMQISVAISQSYFVEIAKLRALRILLANVFKAYGVDDGQMPEIIVHLAKETQTENVNTNMIRASIQGMAGVIGGADRLYILPANKALKETATKFTRRIARNVQHLFRMESFLHKVADPGAGSYFIETLTDKIAEKAWMKFQELEAEGAFK